MYVRSELVNSVSLSSETFSHIVTYSDDKREYYQNKGSNP
jgi:hypothetical protein